MTVAARATDPQTSLFAAQSIPTAHLERRVLECLRKRGAMTSHEIALALGISLVTVSPRLRPLEKRGSVERVGTKLGLSGRAQTLWRAT